ncbi:MAG: hypothetical protein U0R44_05215 [Candidatus Micrarchaeia archaeon]
MEGMELIPDYSHVALGELPDLAVELLYAEKEEYKPGQGGEPYLPAFHGRDVGMGIIIS